MKTKALLDYLISYCDSENLYASIPLLGWGFGSDNMADLAVAVTQLTEPTTIIIRQFTSIYSSVPYKNDSSKFLPMKRMIAGVIDREQVNFLPAIETKKSFEICSEPGAKLVPIKDYSYVEPEQILRTLRDES